MHQPPSEASAEASVAPASAVASVDASTRASASGAGSSAEKPLTCAPTSSFTCKEIQQLHVHDQGIGGSFRRIMVSRFACRPPRPAVADRAERAHWGSGLWRAHPCAEAPSPVAALDQDPDAWVRCSGHAREQELALRVREARSDRKHFSDRNRSSDRKRSSSEQPANGMPSPMSGSSAFFATTRELVRLGRSRRWQVAVVTRVG
jgi:hypothetical protein